MLKFFYEQLMKFFYKFFIVKIQTLNKNQIKLDNKLKEILNVVINTNKGDMIFYFYHDRRNKKRNNYTLPLSSFIVSVKVPEGGNDLLKELENYVIIVIMFRLPFVNYKVLGKLLFDLCLDKYLELAEIVVLSKNKIK